MDVHCSSSLLAAVHHVAIRSTPVVCVLQLLIARMLYEVMSLYGIKLEVVESF